MLVCQGPLFYLKYAVKMGNHSKTIAFRVMSIDFQLHLVMMSKYPKFDIIDIFNTFWVMGNLKVFLNDGNNNNDDLAITINQLFLLKRRAKNTNTSNYAPLKLENLTCLMDFGSVTLMVTWFKVSDLYFLPKGIHLIYWPSLTNKQIQYLKYSQKHVK